MTRTTFGSVTWRSRSQHDLAAISCPAHNFVICSWILQLFHRNDDHIETMGRLQDLCRYLVGQCHSMTLQENRVRHIPSLFEVWFNNYFTEMMITILRRLVPHNIWVATLVKVTTWPCSLKNRVQPITSLFEVRFYNYFNDRLRGRGVRVEDF
jgi:hypothetical protein